MARKGSHQVDAILVPAAARAGREDEKLATVAPAPASELAFASLLPRRECTEALVCKVVQL